MKKILNLATISLLAIFLFSCAGDDKKPVKEFTLEGVEFALNIEKGNYKAWSIKFEKDYARFIAMQGVNNADGTFKEAYVGADANLKYTYDAKKQLLSFTGELQWNIKDSNDFSSKPDAERIVKNHKLLGVENVIEFSFISMIVGGKNFTKQTNLPIKKETKQIQLQICDGNPLYCITTLTKQK